MLINSSKYDYYNDNIKSVNPIISHIKSKSNSDFTNSDSQNSNSSAYHKQKKKENSKISEEDHLVELNQILYIPSSTNTMILKSRFETIA